MGRRINVTGLAGSGKTTISGIVAQRLGLGHIELDELFHGPNWTPPPADEFRRRVLAAIDGLDGWVVDGNYEGYLEDLVLARADTLVWLDLPLHVCLRRIFRRTLRRIHMREELWSAKNRETFRNAFFARDSLFVWTVKAHVRRKREWPARLARYPGLDVIRLRTEDEISRWLASL